MSRTGLRETSGKTSVIAATMSTHKEDVGQVRRYQCVNSTWSSDKNSVTAVKHRRRHWPWRTDTDAQWSSDPVRSKTL